MGKEGGKERGREVPAWGSGASTSRLLASRLPPASSVCNRAPSPHDAQYLPRGVKTGTPQTPTLPLRYAGHTTTPTRPACFPACLLASFLVPR
ncbi:hypothetical protein E2C01_087217 [Portunus trituberculatus]|uniref:Uncharacterized protein n=1 Tax=Portunus trituberculatus TaxID=210409 RepID=A0A5B7JBV5_PORTR|nr:hypothetical protein [Portunus trituberculatus]